MHGALGRSCTNGAPPQVADFVRIKGSGRYAPGQTEEGALADMRRELDALEARFPGLKADAHAGATSSAAPTMPPFEVAHGQSASSQAINARLSQQVRGEEQPTGADHAARLLRHRRRPSLSRRRHGRHRLRPGRPLQHHARRAGRHRRLLDMIRIYMLAILDICA